MVLSNLGLVSRPAGQGRTGSRSHEWRLQIQFLISFREQEVDCSFVQTHRRLLASQPKNISKSWTQATVSLFNPLLLDPFQGWSWRGLWWSSLLTQTDISALLSTIKSVKICSWSLVAEGQTCVGHWWDSNNIKYQLLF